MRAANPALPKMLPKRRHSVTHQLCGMRCAANQSFGFHFKEKLNPNVWKIPCWRGLTPLDKRDHPRSSRRCFPVDVFYVFFCCVAFSYGWVKFPIVAYPWNSHALKFLSVKNPHNTAPPFMPHKRCNRINKYQPNHSYLFGNFCKNQMPLWNLVAWRSPRNQCVDSTLVRKKLSRRCLLKRRRVCYCGQFSGFQET